MTRREVILPRRVLAQPSPRIVDLGDCGACVVAGLFGVSIADTYERFSNVDGRPQPFTRGHIVDAARKLADAHIASIPVWLPMIGHHDGVPFGLDGSWQYGHWQDYVRMALEAGYYGIAEIDREGSAHAGRNANHWVAICGWRSTDTMIDEVLVSCSASNPGGYWIASRELLFRHGGHSVVLARPA